MRYNPKKTLGVAGPVFVSNATATPAETTYKAFVASADAGEIAVFNEAEAKVTSALTVGTKYFIAQKTADGVKRTNLFVYKGVKQKDYNAGTLHKQVVTFPDSIAKGNNVNVTIMETTPYIAPFPSWDVNWQSTGTDVYAAMLQIANKINDAQGIENDANGRIARATFTSTQTTFSEFDNDVTLTKGSKTISVATANTHGTGTAPEVGDYVYIKGEIYKVAAVNGLNVTLDRAYQGASEVIDVSAASGADSTGIIVPASIQTLSLVIEALEYDIHFAVAASLEVSGVEEPLTVTTTSFTKSNGRPEDVAWAEEQGMVWEGYRTDNIAHGEDFGKPAAFTDASNTYQSFAISYENDQKSVAYPNAKDIYNGHIIIYLINSATHLDTQFGV